MLIVFIFNKIKLNIISLFIDRKLKYKKLALSINQLIIQLFNYSIIQ
jgi:hypothetical protein